MSILWLSVEPRPERLRFVAPILDAPNLSAGIIREGSEGEVVTIYGLDMSKPGKFTGFALVDLGLGKTGYIRRDAVGQGDPPPGAPRMDPSDGFGWKYVRPLSTANQEVVEYESRADFELDHSEWLNGGWRIKSVSDRDQRSGFARIFLIGWLALLWRPEPHIRVVYERDGSTSATTATAQTPQTSAAATAPAAGATTGIAAEIERLAELKERGVVTDEEFVQAKRRLLDGGG